MNVKEAKSIIKSKAKKIFDNYDKNNFTMVITEWADGDFEIKYFTGKGKVEEGLKITKCECYKGKANIRKYIQHYVEIKMFEEKGEIIK